MTTYILHGGKTSKKSVDNDEFFKQFTCLVNKKKVKILLCYWAREKSEWSDLVERDSFNVMAQTEKEVEFVVAKDVSHLESLVNDCDVVYFSGGKYNMLYAEFAGLGKFQDLINGKVVIGCSSGAFLLCKYSLYSFDRQPNDINIGLGLLPIAVLCHWNIEHKKQEKLAKIKKVDADIQILTLDECKFVTFYK